MVVQELEHKITRLMLGELDLSGSKSSMVLSVLKDNLLAARTVKPSGDLVPFPAGEGLDVAELTEFISVDAWKAGSRRLFMSNSRFPRY